MKGINTPQIIEKTEPCMLAHRCRCGEIWECKNELKCAGVITGTNVEVWDGSKLKRNIVFAVN